MRLLYITQSFDHFKTYGVLRGVTDPSFFFYQELINVYRPMIAIRVWLKK